MFGNIREARYQEGQRDRDGGVLPCKDDSAYLEGYLKGRPEGLDGGGYAIFSYGRRLSKMEIKSF